MKRTKLIFGSALCALLALGFVTSLKSFAKGPKKVDADGGLEIVSVGVNPVLEEIPPGGIVEGEFPMGHVGEFYSAQLVAQGGSGNYTWAIYGASLASGLELNTTTGLVSGTPTDTATGFVTIQCTDNENTSLSDTVNLTFIVYADSWIPQIGEDTITNAVVGKDYTATIYHICSSANDITWTLDSGDLPPGLSVGNSGNWDGLINGTPTTKGTYTFTLRAENSFGFATKEYTIVVEDLMTLTYPSGTYYRGDTIQITSSIGNSNVIWGISAHGSSTISESGLVTIALDETYFYVYVTSKTNPTNSRSLQIDFEQKVPYSVTVIDGTARNSTSDLISRAGVGESVFLNPNEIEGKVFSHWTIEDGSASVSLIYGENQANNIFEMPVGPVILKANYKTIIYNVVASFDVPINGKHPDKTIETASSSYTAILYNLWNGSPIDIDSTVFETGEEYTFGIRFAATSGYLLAESDELSVTINGQVLTKESNYNPIDACWIVNYTALTDEVTYYSINVTNGIPYPTTAEEGEIVTITANEPAIGYVFDKWVSSDVTFADENSEVTTFTVPNKNVSITATYKEIQQYTVSFDKNGGTGEISNVVVNEGTEYTLPPCSFTAPSNKEFKCWLVNNVEKNPGDKITVTADTVVKAVWKDIKVSISFNSNGGTGTMEPVEIVKGETYVLPECTFTAPEGKEFDCWQINDSSFNVGQSYIANDNIVIKAIWKDATSPVDPVDPVDPGTPSDPTPADTRKPGLSGGAIAGIVVGSTAAVSLGGFAVFWFVIKKKTFGELISVTKGLISKIFKK